VVSYCHALGSIEAERREKNAFTYTHTSECCWFIAEETSCSAFESSTFLLLYIFVGALINKCEFDKLVCCAVKHSVMSGMEFAVAVLAKNINQYKNIKYKLLNCIANQLH
jgi:hypothetical protein